MGKLLKRTFATKDFGQVTIESARYVNGGLAVQLYCPMEEAEDMFEPLAKLSLWLPASPRLPKDCFFVKLYSENELIAEDAAKSGWFEEVEGMGTGLDPIWRLLDVKGEGFSLED